MATKENAILKSEVKAHWERETCGMRYGEAVDRKEYFRQISRARYELEPYIPPFANFESAAGKDVLEIGVGAGSDFENWCQHARHATGIDLTEAGIALTRERLELSGIPTERYTLQTADAENLPFEDSSFDIVYTWGVLLCTPDTERAYREAFRVLRPGGTIKTMVYHLPSWVGLQLYLLYGLGRGKPFAKMKQVMFDHLESPGTKGYTVAEGEELLAGCGFKRIKASTKLAVGDFLDIKLSSKYHSPLFRVLQFLYPRWLVRLIGDRYGTNLMLTAMKPETS